MKKALLLVLVGSLLTAGCEKELTQEEKVQEQAKEMEKAWREGAEKSVGTFNPTRRKPISWDEEEKKPTKYDGNNSREGMGELPDFE